MTFGYANSGWSVTGSRRKTSSAAPATLPLSSAARRSSSTMSGPRATFRTRTPSLPLARASASSQPAGPAALPPRRFLGVGPPLGGRRLGQVQRQEVRGRVRVVGARRLLDAQLPVAV